MKDLNKLQTFVRVVQHRSFTKAARDLRMTSSVISKHINELEDMLGFSVLNRSTRGVTPTEAGETIFRNCVALFAEIDNVVTDARNVEIGPCGSLRVLCDPDYARSVVTSLLRAFNVQYPQVRVELSIADSGRSPIQAGYDVIISSNAPSEPGLIARQIAPIPHVICASPEYFRRCGMPSKPEDLREHNCLVNLISAPKEWPFKSGARKFLVEVKGTFCSNDAAVLTGAAVAGVGIVRVPLYVAQPHLAARKLRALFQGMITSREQMSAYYSRNKHLPAKTSTFVDFLGDEVQRETA